MSAPADVAPAEPAAIFAEPLAVPRFRETVGAQIHELFERVHVGSEVDLSVHPTSWLRQASSPRNPGILCARSAIEPSKMIVELYFGVAVTQPPSSSRSCPGGSIRAESTALRGSGGYDDDGDSDHLHKRGRLGEYKQSDEDAEGRLDR